MATFYTKVAAGILAAYWVALGWQAWHVGLTFDEPTHMLEGYLYWLNQPDLFPEDLPPLTKILDGWIPRALGVPLFPEMEVWRKGWKQDVAMHLLDRIPAEQIQEVFYLMRLVRTVFPVLLAMLVWHWGRLLHGERAGLLLLVVAVLSPTALAHGALLKTDLAAAFTYLLFWFCAWRFWREPRGKNSLALGGSVLAAILTKLSLLVVWPLALAVVVVRVARGPRPIRRWLPAAVAAVLLMPYAGMLAANRFQIRRLTRQDITDMRDGREFSKPVLRAAEVFRYIPTPIHLQKAVRSMNVYQRYGAPSYLLGEARTRGHWAYYPLAWLIKTPIAVQILFVAGLLVAARQRASVGLVLLFPAALYMLAATQSELLLGVRLVLPAFPFVVLLGGFAIRQALETRGGQVAVVVLLGWLAGASAFIYPQGISYFNEWVKGPSEGWKYMVDSNVDWGQNLPDLAEYIRQNRIEKVKLYYFGFDKLHRYGVEKQVEMQAPPWGPDLVQGTKPKLVPGWYGVSVTLLPGHLFPREYRDYFQYFRERRPDARAGYGIFLYRVL